MDIETVRRHNQESYQRHKEERIRKAGLRRDKWRRENPQAYKEEIRQYQARPEVKERTRVKAQKYNKEWAKANPQKINAKNKRHRYRKKSAVGTYTSQQWEDRLAYYGWKCYICGCLWSSLKEKDRTIDHVIPLSRGGSNWPANLRPACRKCNSQKNNR